MDFQMCCLKSKETWTFSKKCRAIYSFSSLLNSKVEGLQMYETCFLFDYLKLKMGDLSDRLVKTSLWEQLSECFKHKCTRVLFEFEKADHFLLLILHQWALFSLTAFDYTLFNRHRVHRVVLAFRTSPSCFVCPLSGTLPFNLFHFEVYGK